MRLYKATCNGANFLFIRLRNALFLCRLNIKLSSIFKLVFFPRNFVLTLCNALRNFTINFRISQYTKLEEPFFSRMIYKIFCIPLSSIAQLIFSQWRIFFLTQVLFGTCIRVSYSGHKLIILIEKCFKLLYNVIFKSTNSVL